MLGLTSPYMHELPEYLGYDIRKFKGNIRFLEVVINRDGQSNGIIGLYFDGAVNYYRELPLPEDKSGLEEVYKQLDLIRAPRNKILLLFNKLFKQKSKNE